MPLVEQQLVVQIFFGEYNKETEQLVFDLFGGLYSIEINWEILIPDHRMI